MGVLGPALLTALLLGASFPPADLLLPPFLALAPWGFAVQRWARTPEGGGRGAALGFWTGALAFGVLLHWMVPALSWRSLLGLPAALAVVVALAVVYAGVGWAAVRMARAGVPAALAVPLAWTAGEWLRAHVPGGFPFPWLELGTALASRPELAGLAEWVGVRGVSAWLAAVGALAGVAACRALEPGSRGAAVRTLAGAVLLAGAGAAWSLHRVRTLPVEPVGRVATVQPGQGPEGEGWRGALQRVDSLLGAVAGPLDLVVLPEGLLGDALGAPGDEASTAPDEAGAAGPAESGPAASAESRPVASAASPEAALRALAVKVDAPVVVGAYRTAPRGVTNALAVVTPDGGPLRWIWDKRRLVPGVEWAPPGLPLVSWFGNRVLREGGRGFVPGDEAPGPRLAGVEVAPLVCFEAAFSDDAARAVREGARLLLNASNDAYYGAPGRDPVTIARWQHRAHLVLRAVETRTGAVRSATTGWSGFVEPTGRTGPDLPLSTPGVAVATVTRAAGPTRFVRTGDRVGPLALGLTLLTLLLGPSLEAPWRRR